MHWIKIYKVIYWRSDGVGTYKKGGEEEERS